MKSLNLFCKTAFFFLLITLVNSFAGGFMLNAQTVDDLKDTSQPAIVEDITGLRAEFKEYTQDPGSKVVKFEMILHSTITSDKVRITWTLNGTSAFNNKDSAVQEIRIENGKDYTIPIEVIPTGYGVTEIVGKAESFELGNSFVVTVRKDYASNTDGEILPITDEYKKKKTIRLITKVALYIGGAVILGVIAFLGLRTGVKWYDKDEIDDFEKKN